MGPGGKRNTLVQLDLNPPFRTEYAHATAARSYTERKPTKLCSRAEATSIAPLNLQIKLLQAIES